MTDKPYQRHHTAVCHGDAALGLFMYRLTRFLASASRPAKFMDDFGIRREGIAQTWATWADELGITLKQFRRVLEKGEDLGFGVRAQRAWGPHRVNRLHVAVTEAYVAELARCVRLGPTVYLAEIKAERARADCPPGQGQIAQTGKDTLPTVGKALDSSHTQSLTSSTTASGASRAREQGYAPSVPGEEPSAENHDSETKSPPTPHAHTVQIDGVHAKQIVGPAVVRKAGYEAAYSLGYATTTSAVLAEKLSVPTLTGNAMAEKLRLLGVLEDWKSVCAKNGVLASSDIADDQLAVLDQRCDEQRATRPARPDAMRVLLLNAAVRAGSLSSDDAYVDILDEGTYPTLVEDIDALLRLPEPDKLVPLFPQEAA